MYVHTSAIVEPGAIIGEGSKIWHFTHIMPTAIIGQNCTIGQNVFIADGVKIGNNVKIQNNVSIYTGVICEDDVFLGPSCVFTNIINPRSGVNRKGKYVVTQVKKGATVGANATIVCGHDLGEFSFIGAGAVVVKHVPPYALMIGNPARQSGWMSEFGHKLHFNEASIGICPESGEKYILEGGKVSKI